MSQVFLHRTSGGGTNLIPELTADPVSPTIDTAWILKTTGVGGGTAKVFLGLWITTVGVATTYQLSYFTYLSTIVRKTLSAAEAGH